MAVQTCRHVWLGNEPTGINLRCDPRDCSYPYAVTSSNFPVLKVFTVVAVARPAQDWWIYRLNVGVL